MERRHNTGGNLRIKNGIRLQLISTDNTIRKYLKKGNI